MREGETGLFGQTVDGARHLGGLGGSSWSGVVLVLLLGRGGGGLLVGGWREGTRSVVVHVFVIGLAGEVGGVVVSRGEWGVGVGERGR